LTPVAGGILIEVVTGGRPVSAPCREVPGLEVPALSDWAAANFDWQALCLAAPPTASEPVG